MSVGLAHTRLAIVGVHDGDQPLSDHSGQLRAVVTGEFYPYQELRSSMEAAGHRFRTSSDSELLIHLYEDDPDGFWRSLDGEFSFVLWDGFRRRLVAGRDPFGVKPLFLGRRNGRWILASLAKTIFAGGGARRWDEEAFADHLALSVLPGRSLFEDVDQVEPGTIVTWSERKDGGWERDGCQRYWSPPSERSHPLIEAESSGSLVAEAVSRSVFDRLVADVPVAVHLSGGLDSNIVASVAAKRSQEATFTIRFADSLYDEGAAAAETSRRLGTNHYTRSFGASDYLANCRRTVASGEMIQENGHGTARLLLSELVADTGYRVALAGEGADELFFGYKPLRTDLALGFDPVNRQAVARRQAVHRKRLPNLVGQIHDQLGLLPAWVIERQAQVVLPLFPLLSADFRRERLVSRSQSGWIEEFLADADADALTFGAVSRRLFMSTWFSSYLLAAERLDLDSQVEVRLPYLGRSVVQLALSLPDRSHLDEGVAKPVLRTAFPACRPADTEKRPFRSQPMVESDAVLDRIIDDCEAGLLDSVPMFEPSACLSFLRSVRQQPTDLRASHERIVQIIYSTGLLGAELGLQ